MKYNDIQPYTLAFHKFFMVAKQNTDFFLIIGLRYIFTHIELLAVMIKGST